MQLKSTNKVKKISVFPKTENMVSFEHEVYMDIFTTVLVAFIFFMLALALVGIGWLLTGKARVKFGSCGRNPHKKKDEECGNTTKCGLCDKDKDEL